MLIKKSPEKFWDLVSTRYAASPIIAGKLVRFAGHLGLLPKINLLTTGRLEDAMERAGFVLVDKMQFGESGAGYTLVVRRLNKE